MKLFQKNIWTLFFILTFICSFLLVAAIYIKDQTLLEEYKSKQRYLIEIFQNNLLTQFAEHEFHLDSIAEQFKREEQINPGIIEHLLRKNTLLSNVELFSPDGQLLFSSRHLRRAYAEEMNGATHTGKNEWFKQALTTERMVIGTPYLSISLSASDIWIVPLAKRILNRQGKVIAIISAGLNVANIEKLWQGDNQRQTNLLVTQDKTFSGIINISLKKQPTTSPPQVFDYTYYKYQYQAVKPENISNSIIKSNKATDHNRLFRRKIFNNDEPPTSAENAASQRRLSLDELRFSGEPHQVTIRSESNGKSLCTLVFNERYQLWFSAITSYAELKKSLNQAISGYFIAYFFSVMVLFWLFDWISKIEEEKLRDITYKAQHDALTGLYNRSQIETHFTSALLQKEVCLSLLYIDLSNFKNINDSFGYSYGDLILKEVTKRILNSLKHLSGSAFRLHGDEFVILLKNDDLEFVKRYASNLLQFLAFPYIIDNNQFQINSAIGIANYPLHADNIETLLTYAENSTQQAKKIKNSFMLFSQEDHHRLMQKIEIEQALQQAINTREISLAYQPQIDQNNKLSGVEALVRWHSKKLGFIPPDMFIPIAEETGIMPELGDYILCTALKEISALQRKEKANFTLSVNVSVRQFIQVDFLKKLLQACNDYKDDNLTLILEITESLFIENIETLLPTFNKLKTHNILLSLDDFGTGYSSLSMLRQVPIDELKIDKSFVDHITENEPDRIMLSSIIDMGKNFDMKVVAEGVENKEQVELLKKVDCDLLQGYYFSKPLTLDALADFLKG